MEHFIASICSPNAGLEQYIEVYFWLFNICITRVRFSMHLQEARAAKPEWILKTCKMYSIENDMQIFLVCFVKETAAFMFIIIFMTRW